MKDTVQLTALWCIYERIRGQKTNSSEIKKSRERITDKEDLTYGKESQKVRYYKVDV